MSGLQGVICDDNGEKYSFDECISCSLRGGTGRSCHNPTALIVAMARNQEERKDAGISATMLLDCARKVILAQEEDYWEQPSKYWARFRGTLGHLLMEAYSPADYGNVIEEVRFKKIITVDGIDFEITGKPDHLDRDRKLVIDFKSTDSLDKQPIKFGIPKDGHREQVSIYRWLTSGGTNMDTGEVMDLGIEKGGILYFTMKGTRKIGIDLMSLEETEEFIREKVRPLALYKNEGELPPFWRNERGYRHRFCDFCALRDACDARGESD